MAAVGARTNVPGIHRSIDVQIARAAAASQTLGSAVPCALRPSRPAIGRIERQAHCDRDVLAWLGTVDQRHRAVLDVRGSRGRLPDTGYRLDHRIVREPILRIRAETLARRSGERARGPSSAQQTQSGYGEAGGHSSWCLRSFHARFLQRACGVACIVSVLAEPKQSRRDASYLTVSECSVSPRRLPYHGYGQKRFAEFSRGTIARSLYNSSAFSK